MKKIFLAATESKSELLSSVLSELRQSYEVKSFDEFDGDGVILCIGGDGSLNYVANQLDQDAKILYLPFGTANDFSKSLRLSQPIVTIKKIKEILDSNYKTKVPILRCNDKRFINVASAGAPARVTTSGEDMLKKATGKLSYYMGALEEILNLDDYNMEVEFCDKKKIKLKNCGFIISQGLYAGGGAKVSPSFCPMFGEFFNFVTPQFTDLTNLVGTIIEMQKDEPELDESYVINKLCRTLKVTSDKEIPIKLDGEEYSSNSYEFEKLDQYLEFYLY